MRWLRRLRHRPRHASSLSRDEHDLAAWMDALAATPPDPTLTTSHERRKAADTEER